MSLLLKERILCALVLNAALLAGCLYHLHTLEPHRFRSDSISTDQIERGVYRAITDILKEKESERISRMTEETLPPHLRNRKLLIP